MHSYGKLSSAASALATSNPSNVLRVTKPHITLAVTPKPCPDERTVPSNAMVLTIPSNSVSSNSLASTLVSHIQVKHESSLETVPPNATVVPIMFTTSHSDSKGNGNFVPITTPGGQGGIIHVICAPSNVSVADTFNHGNSLATASFSSGNNVPLSVNLIPSFSQQQQTSVPVQQRHVLRVSVAHPLSGMSSIANNGQVEQSHQIFAVPSINASTSNSQSHSMTSSLNLDQSISSQNNFSDSTGGGSKQPPIHRVGRRCKPKEDKRCEVCGDKALSCNFDALTCESCKAFFRRNASKGINGFKCPYQGNCTITASSRRICKHCRIRKCFEIGMKKEYILTNEERFQKKMKISQNKILKKLEDRGWIARDLSAGEIGEKDLLNEQEIHMIDEVISAYEASLKTTMEQRQGNREAPSITDLVNLAEISIRRAIEMFKRIKSFRSLDKLDQISLLKGGCIELLVLRGVLAYDPEKQRFLEEPDNEQSDSLSLEDLLQGAGGQSGLALQRLLHTLLSRMQSCRVTILLLLVVCLFSDRGGCTHGRYNKLIESQEQNLQDLRSSNGNSVSKSPISFEERQLGIEKLQLQYSQLLKKFLTTKWSVERANHVFPQIIMSLSDLRTINEFFSRQVMCLNLHGVTPLMTEILDIPESPHFDHSNSMDSESCSSCDDKSIKVEDDSSSDGDCMMSPTCPVNVPEQTTSLENCNLSGLEILETPSVVSQQAYSIGSDVEFITSLLDPSTLNGIPIHVSDGDGSVLQFSTPDLLSISATSPPPNLIQEDEFTP